MNATATSRHINNNSKRTSSLGWGGRFAVAGTILLGSLAIAGTAGAASPDPVGDTDQPSQRPGNVHSFSVESNVGDYKQPNVRDHDRPFDHHALVEGQFTDGESIDSCGDDCAPHDDDLLIEEGAEEHVEEPMDKEPVGDEQYGEDYGDDYPHGCGEDELVACPEDYPPEELDCEDYEIYAAGICGDDVPEETDDGTTTTIVTDDYDPTTTTTPLEQVDVEVKGKRTGGESLAYTGSSSKLPLIGAGLLAAGGMAAGLSILARRNRTNGA